MALDLLNGKIKVYNYEPSPVSFPSNYSAVGVFIRGKDEDEDYVIERVALDDIESENTKSDLFKVGRLRFDPKEEDEIYKILGIEDKKNIMSDAELTKVLQDDSIENLKWISSLKSTTLLSRMKSLLFKMERVDVDIKAPHGVLAVVTERNNELKFGGKRHQNSEINKILENDKKKNQDNMLQKQLAELSEKFNKLEKESKEKDEMLSQSQNAMQDLLKMVESLKKEESKEKSTNKRNTSKTQTTKKDK